jgi:hypothetical protein
VLLPASHAAIPSQAADPPSAKKTSQRKANEQPSKSPRVVVTISKDTTYITGPLRRDGYVDYVAALNERCAQGVTSENNAAVLFWMPMGPAEIPKAHRDRFFKMLGIPPLPEQGDYFVPFHGYVQRLRHAGKLVPAPPGKEVVEGLEEFERSMQAREILQRQYEQAPEHPWSKKQFPAVADWLATNEKPLVLVIEGVARPRYYNPTTSEDLTSLGGFFPALQQSREFARALVALAMLRVDEGKVDDAWRDLLASHRLARLLGQRSYLVDALAAIALDGIACSGDRALLQHARLTASQSQRMRDDLEKLPSAVCTMAHTLEIGERFFLLDGLSTGARKGPSSLADLLEGPLSSTDTAKQLRDLAGRVTLDWDEIFRTCNSWYDRVVAACRKPTRAQRKEAIDKINEDVRRLAQGAKDVESLARSTSATSQEAVSRRVSQMLLVEFLPAILPATDADDRATMQFEMVKLAFSLAAYRADHASHPASLGDLVPKYVAQVPKDIFVAGDLHYRLEDGGYVLYSVGPNGKDDGTKGIVDRKDGNETWDDVVVRIRGSERTP